MYKIHAELLHHHKKYYFFGLSLLILIITFVIQFSFYSATIFYNTYAQQLTIERTQQMYEIGKRWQWIGFLIIPVILYVRVLYNSFWVSIGSLLSEKRGSIKDNYNVCLKAEYVFVGMLFVRFIWLLFFKNVNNLTDLNLFPGSVLNLYDIEKIPIWLIYPLQTVNIWEVLFCIVGTSMYSIQHNVSKTKAAQLFCIPYLIGLFIWVLVIVFITLQFT